MGPQWVVLAVETNIAWPTDETKITYKSQEILLRPESDEFAATVCLRYGPTVSSLTRKEATSLLRSFLSALSWMEQKYIRELAISGGSHPIRIGHFGRNRIISHNFRADYLPDLDDQQKSLALALYREALSINSIPFQFLGFFKIINMLHERGREQTTWIRQALPHLTRPDVLDRLRVLNTEHSDVANYLYESGRCAVAHAYSDPIVDPENPDDLSRLGRDLPVVKSLAEYLIEFELGIKSLRTIHRQHFYELEGFKKFLSQDAIDGLKAKDDTTGPTSLQLPTLSIRLRDYNPFASLENLTVSKAGYGDGCIVLQCTSTLFPIVVTLILDFASERLEFDPFQSIQIIDSEAVSVREKVQVELDALNFANRLLGNAQIEVVDADQDELLGRTRPFIPTNIDSIASSKNLETRIKELENTLDSLGDDEK